MKLTVYQPWPQVRSARCCGLVDILSGDGHFFLKLAQRTQRPRNLDPNFTGRRFTWRKRDIQERRMPESSHALLIWSTNLDCCPFCSLPAKTSRLWVPNHFCNAVDQKRENEILFNENLSACWRCSVHRTDFDFSKSEGNSPNLPCALSLSWQ